MHKRFTTSVLSFIIAISLLPSFMFNVSATETKTDIFGENGGNGTIDDPYIISSLETLEKFRDDVNNGNDYSGKYIRLDEDIDLSAKYGEDKGDNNSDVSWISIGALDNDSNNSFNGIFDGNKHQIKNLYISKNTKCAGLFGKLSYGTIKDLTVTGSIANTYNDKHNSSVCTGGIVGVMTDGTIDNCNVNCTINGGVTGYVGGIVGYMNGGTVRNCTNANSASGKASVGGIVGIAYNNSNALVSSLIENCINTGNVTANASAGGIIGYSSLRTNIANCGNVGNITATTKNAGGIVGYASTDTSNPVSINNCYNMGKIGCSEYVGNISGTNISSVTNCYFSENCAAEGTTFTNTIGISKNAEDFTSGVLAYILQENQTNSAWTQTIDGANKDLYPNFRGRKVYKYEDKNGIFYTNDGHKPYEIFDVKTDNGNTTASVYVPKAGSYTLIFASYQNGLLNKIKLVPLTTAKDNFITECSEDFALTTDDEIIIWDSITSMSAKGEIYVMQ